jgi:hypothetical protein
MNNPTWRGRTLIALCAVIALGAVSPAWAAEAPAAQTAASAAQAAPEPAAPLPIFLTGTYLCSYNIINECTGGVAGVCSKVCNVGQTCHCIVQYGIGPGGCTAVKHIYPPSCLGS